MARTWLIVIVALLGLGGLLTVDLTDRHAEIALQEEQRLVSIVSTLDTNLGEQFRASSRMLDLLAQDASALLDENDGVARLNQRMDLLSESVVGIHTIVLVNADGDVRSSNRDELIGQNLRHSERHETMLAGRDARVLHVSEPFATPSGIFTIDLAKAIHDSNGEFGGYLLAVLTPEYFSVLMKSLVYAPDMRLSVIHGDGKIIYSTQSSPDIRGIDLARKPLSLFNRHKAAGGPSTFLIDNDAATNDLRFVAFRTVSLAGVMADKLLMVAVSRNASALFAQWQTMFFQVTGLFIATAIALCVGCVAYSRRNAAYQFAVAQNERVRQRAEFLAQSERFIRTITDSMPGPVAYFDTTLRCCFANKAVCDWYQTYPNSLVGTTLEKMLGKSLYLRNKPHIDAVLSGRRQLFERVFTKRDGSLGHELTSYLPDINECGQINGFIFLATDIRALRLAQTSAKVAASVFENTADGIMVTDGKGIILSVNPAFTAITGYPAHEAVGRTPRLLRSSVHEQVFHKTVWQQIAERGEWKGEVWNRRKNGEVFPMRQAITRLPDDDAQSGRYISVFYDITDSWQQNERYRHLAFHDALTDLPNRALLVERLNRHIVMAEREPRRLAVLFLDLDGFKGVNDTLGHAVGDELLKVVANRLLALLRQTDTVARLGGDEFVVLLDNPSNLQEVLSVADRIIAAVNAPMEFDGGDPVNAILGVSIGIAMYPEHALSSAELVGLADATMYRAKQDGRNTWRFADGMIETV